MLDRNKKWLRPLVLRGRLLNSWIARKARKLDRAYCSELVRPAAAPVSTISVPSFAATGTLRRMLFIADCMWEQNDLLPELRKLCEVDVLDLRPALKTRDGSQPAQAAVEAAVEGFIKTSSHLSPDVILFYARPALLGEQVFHLLRRRWSCPLFGMNMDDKTQFFPYGIFSAREDNYQAWARNFDLNLTSSLVATGWYQQRGYPALYLPPGMHQAADMSMPSACEYRYGLTFVGSRKPERQFLIKQLLDFGVPIDLFGTGWSNAKWVDDAKTIYRTSQINLGIGFASPSLALTSLKGRDFECPGAGACYLTTYNWELPNHFELGKEVLCYRSMEELIEMYSYYHTRPKECLEIAQAAWRRCAREHTWEQRFRKVFQETGFKL